ncbi:MULTISPECIES: hypothetical protein [unclassified Streptococcus]|jgi:hypothetical protein|uniref:hypothetical protein n=1 Tax=unclassified Streptococcus TaxID=2608887 RepID=UPI001292CB72|nr:MULTISPECIES: hypothetical protein [unclassified Streptococcus]MQQ66556.1 hypothetical protein [Streptococcus mitis]
MAKKSIEEKIYNGKTYRTSAFLKKKLYLSAESSRRILQDYEHNPDLGVNPKFYDEKIINQIIEDYYNDESKMKSIEKRKIKLEKERALQEKISFENYESELVDVADWFLINKRIEKDLVIVMLKNLFSAMGKRFDMDLFNEDVAKVEKYNRAVGGYGIPRPLDIVEADDRLNADDGYLE